MARVSGEGGGVRAGGWHTADAAVLCPSPFFRGEELGRNEGIAISMNLSSPCTDKEQMVPISDHLGAWEDQLIIQCERSCGSGICAELSQEQSSFPNLTSA